MKFCCRNFKCVQNNKNIIFTDVRTNTEIIRYKPYFRSYIVSHGKKVASFISYCPWCGKKLPKELSDEWYDILEKEYDIDDPLHHDRKKVPKEFWTDEWWKNRGL